VPTTDFQVHDGLLVVQQTSEGDRLRIALQGEMDLANADGAASIVSEALDSGKHVVIDLAKLEFLDSTGLALVVDAMRNGGERLSFLPSEHTAVHRLLSLTGLDERMRFEPAGGGSPERQPGRERRLAAAGRLARPDLTRQPDRLGGAAAPGLAVPGQDRADLELGEGVERAQRPLAVGGGGAGDDPRALLA
jgi:anti-anti-sigma factor